MPKEFRPPAAPVPVSPRGRKPATASRGDTSGTVVTRIQQMIERRELRPGVRLPSERALAARFGVSRGSLRTALGALEGLGVIASRHGSGTFVVEGPPRLPSTGLSMLSGLHDVPLSTMYEARTVIETQVAAMAAQHATPDQVALLTTQLDAMAKACSENQAQVFWQHDVMFHRTITEAAGNQVLASLMHILFDVIYDRERHTVQDNEDLPAAVSAHKRVLAAIKRHDGPAAAQAMQKHLQQATEPHKSPSKPKATR